MGLFSGGLIIGILRYLGNYDSDSHKICLKCVKKANIKTAVKYVHGQKFLT